MYFTCVFMVSAEFYGFRLSLVVCRLQRANPCVAPSTAAAHAASPAAPTSKPPRSGIVSRSTVPAGRSLSMDAVDRPCYAFVESRLPRSLAAADSIAAAAGHASAARFPNCGG